MAAISRGVAIMLVLLSLFSLSMLLRRRAMHFSLFSPSLTTTAHVDWASLPGMLNSSNPDVHVLLDAALRLSSQGSVKDLSFMPVLHKSGVLNHEAAECFLEIIVCASTHTFPSLTFLVFFARFVCPSLIQLILSSSITLLTLSSTLSSCFLPHPTHPISQQSATSTEGWAVQGGDGARDGGV